MWLLSVSLSNKPRAWEAQRVRGGEFKKGEEEKKEEEQELVRAAAVISDPKWFQDVTQH